MKQALLSTGFPYDLPTSKKNNINHFINFLYHAQAVRRDGSAAMNLDISRVEGLMDTGR